MQRATVALGLVAVTAGCTALGLDGARKERRPAYISSYEERSLVEAPDTVSAGAPFTVTVHTFGGGCIGPGDTVAEVQGSVVTVRPFDVVTTHLPANQVCTAAMYVYAHDVTVRVSQPGAALIRVIGRVDPGDSVTMIERPVVVR